MNLPVPEEDQPPSETRTQRLARIRREVLSGEYDTPDRLEAALDSFLGEYAVTGSPRAAPHFRR